MQSFCFTGLLFGRCSVEGSRQDGQNSLSLSLDTFNHDTRSYHECIIVKGNIIPYKLFTHKYFIKTFETRYQQTIFRSVGAQKMIHER